MCCCYGSEATPHESSSFVLLTLVTACLLFMHGELKFCIDEENIKLLCNLIRKKVVLIAYNIASY